MVARDSESKTIEKRKSILQSGWVDRRGKFMSELVIYQPESGEPVAVRLDGDTLWLNQEQMAELFGRERSVITKHLKNVFKEEELVEESNVQNLHIAGSDKPVKFYSLDAIISIGYRVNSKRGTLFRQWATNVLRNHLTQGWTLDRARMDRNAAELEAALTLVRKTARIPELSADMGAKRTPAVFRYKRSSPVGRQQALRRLSVRRLSSSQRNAAA
ncbi:MAG TPA: RhuM family protein [Caballeronia sp.]|nr:RhuM family protein [Caballeronia sp.]